MAVRRYLALSLAWLAAACLSQPDSQRTDAESDPGPWQAVSLLGDTLYAPALPDSVRWDRERKLEAAQAAYQRSPHDPDSIIWLGRRLAYLGRYREALDIYTQGLAQHPEDPRLYRHRGHRYITTRQLDLAIEDLHEAARLTAGRPDEVEPDGLPNARGIPTSTLQFNIWYHLGLAYYLQGRFPEALEAYENGLDVSDNPDALVAMTHWLYMTMRRQGYEEAAARLLEPVSGDMDIVENFGYFDLVMMYRGEQTVDDVRGAAQDPLHDATVGYGIGNWYYYNGQPETAERLFGAILEGSQWAAFGYIAAEAERARDLD